MFNAFTKRFHDIFTSAYTLHIFMPLNDGIINLEKPDRIRSSTFVQDDFCMDFFIKI